MNLACILFFSYAPLVLVAQGSSPTGAASLVSVAIWFTILAIPTGGYLVHRSGRPAAAIVACALIAAIALALFAAGVHPTISCLLFGVAVGPLSGAILSLPAMVLSPRDRSVGFGVFYTCFYVLMAVGPLAAGRLQDTWGSPSAALIAGAALLVAIVPLCSGLYSCRTRIGSPNSTATRRLANGEPAFPAPTVRPGRQRRLSSRVSPAYPFRGRWRFSGTGCGLYPAIRAGRYRPPRIARAGPRRPRAATNFQGISIG